MTHRVISRDVPMLFSGAMVRALLKRRKTQTRRLLKPQPDHLQVYEWKGKRLHDSEYRHWCWKGHVGNDNWQDITQQLGPFLPYQVGDRLWVREAFSYDRLDVDHDMTLPPWYWADGNPADGDWTKPKPSIHMPRIYSRITLVVKEVRVQRVQDIPLLDVWAEGVEVRQFALFGADAKGRQEIGALHYRHLWDDLNAKRASWSSNPWVAAISFSVHRINVDQMPAREAA